MGRVVRNGYDSASQRSHLATGGAHYHLSVSVNSQKDDSIWDLQTCLELLSNYLKIYTMLVRY